MQIAVLEGELKKVYETLGKYELLSVDENNGTRTKTFYADGIIVFRKNYRDIGFSRTFADTIVTQSFIDNMIVDYNVVILQCGQVKYKIVPIKKNSGSQEKILLPDIIYIDTLINGMFFDTENIIVEHNMILTPINLKKLGKLSLKQKTAIKRIIENKLNGSQVEFQCCRVPAFSVEFKEDEYIIYGHIYDYATKCCLNKVELYKSSEDFNNINPYNDYLEYVNNFRI